MPIQVTGATTKSEKDRRLDLEQRAIVKRLLDIRAIKDTLEKEERILWQHVFNIADDIVGESKPYRYLDRETLMVVGREIRHPTDLNVEGLLADPRLPSNIRKRIIKVVEIIDPVLLEAELHRRTIQPEIVAEYTTIKEVPVRVFRKAPKEEIAQIQMDQEIGPPFGPI